MIIEAVLLMVGVASVASTEITGKGLADHAISKIADRDCKLARIVHDEKICQNEPEGSVTISVPIPTSPRKVVNTSVSNMEDIFARRKSLK
jgi:predicted regulator of amino acid metabolism with ACT domain